MFIYTITYISCTKAPVSAKGKTNGFNLKSTDIFTGGLFCFICSLWCPLVACRYTDSLEELYPVLLWYLDLVLQGWISTWLNKHWTKTHILINILIVGNIALLMVFGLGACSQVLHRECLHIIYVLNNTSKINNTIN